MTVSLRNHYAHARASLPQPETPPMTTDLLALPDLARLSTRSTRPSSARRRRLLSTPSAAVSYWPRPNKAWRMASGCPGLKPTAWCVRAWRKPTCGSPASCPSCPRQIRNALRI